MEPRSSSLPTTTPDAGILDLWQGLIVGLGPLAAAYDRRWCPRRRVLDTLRVMLFVFLLACARRQGCTTTLAELWAPCRGLDAPLPQPISAAARSKARPQLDENEFKPCHPEILRRAAPPGAQGLLSCRSPWIPSRAAANARGAGAASRGPTAAPTGVSQRDPRAHLRADRDWSPPAAPEPPIPATIQAPSLAMGPMQTRGHIARPMSTPRKDEMDVTRALPSRKSTRFTPQTLKLVRNSLSLCHCPPPAGSVAETRWARRHGTSCPGQRIPFPLAGFPMTPLRQRMTEDMQVRNLSPCTQKTYINQVSLFARHFGCSPDRLGPERTRDYQVFLATGKRLAPGSIAIAVAALRFLYSVTLNRDWDIEAILPTPGQPKKLPVVPSPEEVRQLPACVRPLANQAILTTCYAAGLRI